MADDGDTVVGGIDRRQLLKRGAVAGAVLVWAVPTVEVLTAQGAAAASAPPPRCNSDKDDLWHPNYRGRPPVFHNAAPVGYYLWHHGIWSLRVSEVHGGATHIYTGTISTAGVILGVTPYQLHAPHDRYVLSPDGHFLTFEFVTHGGMTVGIDFTSRCADNLRFALDLDGHPISRQQVWIGHGDMHPARVPFYVRKHDDQPG